MVLHVSTWAQITYEDISATFLENQNNFVRSNIDLKWQTSIEFSTPNERFQEAYDAYTTAIEEAKLKEGSREKMGAEFLRSSYDLQLQSVDLPWKGSFHVFHCKRGCRLRIAKDPKVNWADGWPNFDGNNELYVYTTDIDVENFCSLALSQYNQNAGGIVKHFTVLPRNAPEMRLQTESIMIPVLLPFGRLDSPFVSPIKGVFPDEASSSRKQGKISIREEGDIAIIEIVELPLTSVGERSLLGLKLYAEIEKHKGCHPRLVKFSTINDINGEIFQNDSYWEYVYELTISELSGVGFYPSETILTEYRWFPSKDDVARILQNKHFDISKEKSLKRPAEQILEWRKTKMKVEKISTWSVEESNRSFSLDVPNDAERVIDQKTGKNYVKLSEQTKQALAARQAELKDDIQPTPVLNKKTWIFFWAGLSALGLIVLISIRYVKNLNQQRSV